MRVSEVIEGRALSSTGEVFPIVGIGASAGGLDALKRLFSSTPPDTGVAFVLVQHLDPNHESLMADLLAKCTEMSVAQAEDGLPVLPNHVYVIPPRHYLSIGNGVLHLEPPAERRGMRMPIDHFLRSLAEDLAERAICIILSGTGTDGTLGLREIKGHGGMTMVQEPSTAQYDGMPHSALSTGLADYRLPVEEMPGAIVRYLQHPYARGELPKARDAGGEASDLGTVVSVVRARTGHDFRHYKTGTLSRRIARRMGLATIENLDDYVEVLRSSEDEVQRLVRDLLISVTSFFREREAFDSLAANIVPALVARAGPDIPIRVWIPGCASGEEAYSIAILFLDAIRGGGKQITLQVFATDIDQEALDVARSGVYPISAIADLPSDLQRNYFTRDGERATVNKSVRESVVFAAQNLISDPPFSRLDFISCRNLLIYLDNQIQAKLIPLFHFALREGGFLFLGNSETIGHRTDIFKTVSKKWRIYRRLDVPADVRNAEYYPALSDGTPKSAAASAAHARPSAGRRMSERVEAKLLSEYAPAAVLVDRSGEALYFHGNCGDFLETPSGVATHDIVTLAREGMRTALRTTLQAAIRSRDPAEASRIRVRGGPKDLDRIRIKVWPVDENDGTYVVCFEREPETVSSSKVRPGDEMLVKQLEYELKATREDLQTTIEEVETTNEDLKAANEEVMSMNEELQSSNEELETSKEELQSLNEELSTVNNQLLDKLHELEAANNDLANLLVSTEIATIFLDDHLCVRRFTPSATRMFALIDSDVGRPIGDVAKRFSNGDLTEECAQVLKTLAPFHSEVCDQEDNWFQLRVLPYRTADNQIDGVVITFAEITELRRAYRETESLARQLRIVSDALPALIAHVDLEHRFQFVNGAYERWFSCKTKDIVGQPVCEVFGSQAYQSLCPQLKRATHGETVEATATLTHGALGERDVNMTWVPELGEGGKVLSFYSLIHDVTEQKRAERRLMAADVVFRSTTEAAAILDEDGRIVTVNPAFLKVTGHKQQQCIGKHWSFVQSEHESYRPAGLLVVRDEGGWRGEAWLRRASGEVFAAWVTLDVIRPAKDDDEIRGYVAVFADISSIKEAERRLEFLAHHDALTGLVNRVMFTEQMNQMIARAERQKRMVGLLYLDLDGFKHINDGFGHELGDQVLVVVAQRLKTSVRAEDTLARLGGDEFGILIEDVADPWSVGHVAQKIADAMREPIRCDKREFVLTVSIGISIYPNDGTDVTILVRNADTAMYKAKSAGGSALHFYTPSLTEAVQQRMSTEAGLRRAIERGELELYYQPIVAIAGKQIVGAEALLRWRTKARGLLLPESFLPIAEMSGLVVELGRHVIDLALAQLLIWRQANVPVPRLSVNISARQCADEGFTDSIRTAIETRQVPPAALDLEITESCFLDKKTAGRALAALNELGFSLTIDDFGTGYATLTSLRNAPISAIKIDRAFVDDLGGKSSEAKIADAVVALGKSQGLHVIAEGVEHEEQLHELSEMQCDAYQGYLLAPPMSAERFGNWLVARGAQVDQAWKLLPSTDEDTAG
ncbi:MAG: EAL domain-containing protein [Zoogloeaceae bacterium]|nr:EAL domain-containing protein [Zoogloeaceae bacterium]